MTAIQSQKEKSSEKQSPSLSGSSYGAAPAIIICRHCGASFYATAQNYGSYVCQRCR